MKCDRFPVQQSVFLLILFMLSSCGAGDKKSVSGSKSPLLKSEQPKSPFAFYKDISVRPGMNFEVISWGKGVDSVGGYTVFLSDTDKSAYHSLSKEREGILSDAWNMDLDNDGNPEVYIELLLDHKTRSDLHVYEYAGGNFYKITFPGLSSKLKSTYAGADKFSIRDGDLYRTFKLSTQADPNDKSSATKTLRYRLDGNVFSVSEEEIK